MHSTNDEPIMDEILLVGSGVSSRDLAKIQKKVQLMGGQAFGGKRWSCQVKLKDPYHLDLREWGLVHTFQQYWELELWVRLLPVQDK
jgi:hypothetical protein